MRPARALARITFGLAVVLHALAHAVFPLRGLLEFPPATLMAVVGVVAYLTALIALFAAGVGILWSRVFAKHVPRLMGLGIVASVVALIAAWEPGTWRGLAADVVLIVAFVAAMRAALLEPRERASSRRRRMLRIGSEALACGLVVYVGIGAIAWPWHRRWGATPHEQSRQFPGDPSTRNPRYELTHALTINAPPNVVWSWLVQLGQDRAGFYSYDRLERLFGADVHNIAEVRAEWQQRHVGDFVRATQPDYLYGLFGREVGWRVTQLEPNRLMVLEHWGAFILEPEGQAHTRFIIRSTIGGPDTPAWGAGLTFALFELPHFIMERKMMLTIKARAEGHVPQARVAQGRR